MRKRQNRKRAIVLVNALAGLTCNCIPDKVFVRKFHALGTPRSAGGVNNGSGIIFFTGIRRRGSISYFRPFFN